ncbi:MAG: hypothetical protein A2174_01230 [Candidatus Portnoybacteria bacterium RBG_13_41_18]|uniref:DUF3352 domain-containing protein n=1 Tax=Candidatus Portnoybacteria bacterium RBG_13_41_18 TaxID=1801991 RepID=A0A1G2F5T2_9BACT|nr:MAG: hypothetical protein A2174_01230 [Candidatus Portnoybacteria bacterium RBG_13_41_18]
MNNETTSLRVNKKLKADQWDIENALNLNRQPAIQPTRFSRSRIWLFLAGIFFLISCGLAAKIFLFEKILLGQFSDKIPPQAISASLIKLPDLTEGASGLGSLFRQNAAFSWWQDQIVQFLNLEGLSVQEDLLPALKDEAAFLIMPARNDHIVWAAIAQKENSQELAIQDVFGRIESGLQKRLGVSEQIYRQIEINSVFSLRQPERIYYWSQIDDFIIISNNFEAVKAIIDQNIKRGIFF